MIGLVVLAPERGCGLPPQELLEPFLGAPLLARGIAAALPTDEAVAAVVVVPAALVERVKAEVIERFGLDEVGAVIAGGPDRTSALRAGLDALPAEVDFVLVQEGARALVPNGMVERVVAAARQGDGAAPAVSLHDLLVADEAGALRLPESPSPIKCVQGPGCYRVAPLRAVLAAAPSDALEAELLARAGAALAVVAGDDDNLLVREGSDVSRALEVFARRAVDYAFIYPKDLLPEDPVARALDAAAAASPAERTSG